MYLQAGWLPFTEIIIDGNMYGTFNWKKRGQNKDLRFEITTKKFYENVLIAHAF